MTVMTVIILNLKVPQNVPELINKLDTLADVFLFTSDIMNFIIRN